MNTPTFRTAAFAFAALAATTFAQSGPAFDKATGIRFPKIEFADAKLEDAATYLVRASRDLAADKSGLNIVIKSAHPAEKNVSLKVTNMPAPEAVRYCAEAAGFSVTWSGEVAILSDQKAITLPTVAFDAGGRALFQRASKALIPRVDFQDATTREALEFLAGKINQASPAGPKINIILNTSSPARPSKPAPGDTLTIPGLNDAPAPAPAAPVSGESIAERRITLRLANITATEAIRVIALMADATVRWDTHAIVLGTAGSENRPAVVNTVAVKGKLISEKLNAVLIPKVDFRESKLSESADFLSRKLKELDAEHKGANLLANGPAAEQMLTVKLEQIPALEALRYMAELSGTDLRIEHNALVFQPR